MQDTPPLAAEPKRPSRLAQLSNRIDGAVSWYGRVMYRVVRHGVPVILFFVGAAFAFRVFVGARTDTSTITTGAFALLASLAAVVFAYARAIEDDAGLKNRITWSAERLLHAALLALSLSGLKLGWLWLVEAGAFEKVPALEHAIEVVLGIAMVVLFNVALVSAHGGFARVNESLWERLHRQPDWDDLFAPTRNDPAD
jgi:hypothetical protein